MVAAIAFIAVFLSSANVSMNETNTERLGLYDETGVLKTLGDEWTDTGDNWAALEGDIPAEAYGILIIPIIIIAAFIAIRVVSSMLPNWLSGG